MNKKLIIIITLLIASIAGSYVVNQKPNSTDSKSYGHRIALFKPISHPAMQEIEQGLRETLQKISSASYTIDVYNANGSKTLMRAQAEEIVSKNYDLIYPIGAGCTQMAKEITAKKHNPIPIVFGAVDNPVGTYIAQSLTSSGNNVTGILEAQDYDTQISLTLAIHPKIKKMLLVYDPSQGSGLEREKNKAKKVANQYGITMTAVEVFQISELQQKVSGFMADTDAVMILIDNNIVSGIDSLVKLCNQYHVPLIASDLNSCDKGAALAYGVHQYDYGSEGAKKVQLILENKKHPSQVPITPIANAKMRINRVFAQKQGILHDEEQLHQLDAVGVI